MGRIIAIDYGTKRTGIAASDPLRIIANAVDTIPTHNLMSFLEKYIAENNVDIVVVGLPRQMNGELSDSFRHIEPFVNNLRKKLPGLQIEYHDERFTSKLAMRAMIEGGVSKAKRRDKALIDRVSATIILQSYMESNKSTI